MNDGDSSFRILYLSRIPDRLPAFPRRIVIVADPAAAGPGDSERAMGYSEPWDDNRE